MDGGSRAVATAAAIERLTQHGGRLGVARAAFPAAPEPWIDLSTGINPHAYPAPASTAVDRARLPDPLRLRELERVAARGFGVDEPRRVVATPGTELALRLLPIAIGAKHAAIVTPTYSSHADAWRRAGATVVESAAHQLDLDSAAERVVVIVNPNNPDGAAIVRERVLELHDELHANGGSLVIDEAFVDVDPALSICDLAGTPRAPNLIALRSFGKFYGLAGVRLGFAIGSSLVTERLRGLIGDWPVSGDALAAGLAAYADTEWARKMRAMLRREATQLDALLVEHDFSIIGGTSLFRLARHANAAAMFERLLRAGILTRPFAHDATLLRFGLPGGDSAWRRLAAVLQR